MGYWKGYYRSEDFCTICDCYSLKQLHQQRKSKQMHSVQAMKPKCTSPPKQQMHEFDTLYTAEMEQQRTRRILGFMINLSPDSRRIYSNDKKKKKGKEEKRKKKSSWFKKSYSKLLKGLIMAEKINLLTIFLFYLKSKGHDPNLENCKRSEL